MEAQEYHTLRAVEDSHWWFRSLNEHAVRCLREACPVRRPRLFDAGCGTGGLAAKLAEIGDVEGVDASPLAVRYCHERGLDGIREGDLNALELPAGRYDAISCVDVLYHRGIRDDSAVLATLARGLRPGGVLFLHLPAYEWLRSRHDLLVHTSRRYRLSGVRRLLRGAGLVTEHGSYRVTLFFPAVALLRLLRGKPERADGPSDVRRVPVPLNGLLLAVCRLENAVSRRLALPFGVSLYAVARKP